MSGGDCAVSFLERARTALGHPVIVAGESVVDFRLAGRAGAFAQPRQSEMGLSETWITRQKRSVPLLAGLGVGVLEGARGEELTLDSRMF